MYRAGFNYKPDRVGAHGSLLLDRVLDVKIDERMPILILRGSGTDTREVLIAQHRTLARGQEVLSRVLIDAERSSDSWGPGHERQRTFPIASYSTIAER